VQFFAQKQLSESIQIVKSKSETYED